MSPTNLSGVLSGTVLVSSSRLTVVRGYQVVHFGLLMRFVDKRHTLTLRLPFQGSEAKEEQLAGTLQFR